MMKSEFFTAIASRLCGAYITGQVRRTIQIVTSARQWAAFAGGPMTPAGCTILAFMVGAMLLAGILTTCGARVGIGSVFWVGCWFS
ncbi:hypothetical protein M3I53_35990 [Paraburkholderia sp. CNPSo 3272]|uniref:hypothetical protein n=1 Tax=Paraburkholderia sp. CNPSo 3272 TaxID=2940931 RepID=UPI0020B847A9|nr:hypothetical protein [Paraburkholderia sp. CNPSo 3272]MCP3728450.1 hypothetical protein [Paraburkholderia sp. CNPSo 3272]